jgi:hypothetical protein
MLATIALPDRHRVAAGCDHLPPSGGGSRKARALPAEERLFWSIVISVIVRRPVAFVLAAMGGIRWPHRMVQCPACRLVLALVSRGNLRLGELLPPTARWRAAIPPL